MLKNEITVLGNKCRPRMLMSTGYKVLNINIQIQINKSMNTFYKEKKIQERSLYIMDSPAN